MQDVNLREMFAAFCEVYAPARELMRGGTMLGELERCARCAARSTARVLTRVAGILVTGEAAGSTYAFSGEGIGKAMETGMLAARALIDATAPRAPAAHDDGARRSTRPTRRRSLR